MHLLRKHQERLVDKFMNNVSEFLNLALDKETGAINKDELQRTCIIAPWCDGSGKTGVIEYLSTKLIHMGYRILVYVANDNHMKQRYKEVKTNLRSAWRLKAADDDTFFVTSDNGGIAYFVSNESGNEIISRMKPKVHVLLVEEGDFVTEPEVQQVIDTVPTSLIIGTRLASASGLITQLISQQSPNKGISIDVIAEDDLLAQGYDRSIHATLDKLKESKDALRQSAKDLSKNDKGVNTNENSTIGSDDSSESTNKKDPITLGEE